MMGLRSARRRWLPVLAASCVVVPALALTADAAPPQAKAKKAAKKAEAQATATASTSREDVAEAREILKAFQDLGTALQKEKTPAKGSKSLDEVLKTLGRPGKTVEKSSLDSAAIDALLEKGLVEAKVQPARHTSDEEFVRRVCLDMTGKLPTPEQVMTFLHSKNKDKRADLIDYLLSSPDYASNWAHYFRDVIRFHATAENLRLINYPKLEEWLAGEFEKNTPWDEIARKIITASGPTDENGAAVFTAAQMGQAVELAGEVSRVFLGVQIQCAQCHDHPNDPWKREQFHQFAAFFAGIQARRNAKDQKNPTLEITTRPGAPRYTMPDLKDPQKQIPVQPRFFLASSAAEIPAGLTAQQRRELAASYITGQDNPWFAKAFVNRVWYVLMGDGFYNPVDDIGPTRTAHAQEVIDTLAAEWQKGGYDVRWLFRAILNTKAYQREFRPSNTSAGKTPFAANCPSRLRSDQIYEALAQALSLSPTGPGSRADRKEDRKDIKGEVPKGAAARMGLNQRTLFNFLFGVDPSMANDDVLGTIPQALFMMNSPVINNAVHADKGKVLGEILNGTPDNRLALEALYLKVLARRPTADEVKTCGRYIMTASSRKEAFEDILWALINSTEFISRR